MAKHSVRNNIVLRKAHCTAAERILHPDVPQEHVSGELVRTRSTKHVLHAGAWPPQMAIFEFHHTGTTFSGSSENELCGFLGKVAERCVENCSHAAFCRGA